MPTMNPQEIAQLTRRDFLVNAGRGVGGLAFASLLRSDGLLAGVSGALLADDAVHLRAVYGWCTLDRANGEQVGVAACGGVGECCTGGR